MKEYNKPYGDEVGKGWQPIVMETHVFLKYLDPQYRIAQIKEKFGGLRYYFIASESCTEITGGLMDIVVRDAERRCANTCENCSAVGELNSGRGWYATLCKKCNGLT